MKDVSAFLENHYGFALVEGNSSRQLYRRMNFSLLIAPRWEGRWEEFICYTLYEDEKEILNLTFQVDTGLSSSEDKPKIFNSEEIKAKLVHLLNEIMPFE